MKENKKREKQLQHVDRPTDASNQSSWKEGKKSWRDISRLFLGVWCCCVLHTYNHHSVSGKNLITEIELNINWKCMGRCKHNITHAACIFFHRLSTFFSPSSSSYLVDVIRRNQINIQKTGEEMMIDIDFVYSLFWWFVRSGNLDLIFFGSIQ